MLQLVSGQEENVRGAYSFNKAGRIFNDDAANLKEKLGNVWFGGKATNTDWLHATTVGAWDTGEEAAQGVVAILKR